jgi:hypothetical protein
MEGVSLCLVSAVKSVRRVLSGWERGGSKRNRSAAALRLLCDGKTLIYLELGADIATYRPRLRR